MSFSAQTMRIGRVRGGVGVGFDADEVIELATEAKAVGARVLVEKGINDRYELFFEKEIRP